MYQSSLVLFISSFVAVFLLGTQSQFVRDKLILQSFITSLGIGLCQLFMLKLAPNATVYESVAFVFGGAFGIATSIIVHTFVSSKYK
jgi:hypothetical protein